MKCAKLDIETKIKACKAAEQKRFLGNFKLCEWPDGARTNGTAGERGYCVSALTRRLLK